MLYNKVTTGFVVQTFDDWGNCLRQEFVANDRCVFEIQDDNKVLPITSEQMPFGGNEYFPFDMVQPQ